MQSVSLVEALLMVLVVSVPLASADNPTCIGDREYHSLESSLLKWPQNLVNLSEAFFPTNRQQSISVPVAYHFNGSNEPVKYRWLYSPINLLIRSELLHYLALTMYQVELRYANVTLDPICNFHSENVDLDKICLPSNLTVGHHLLNNLTANVSIIFWLFINLYPHIFHLQLLSYAKHRNSVTTNGFDSSTENGYSVYVFGTDPGDYCIFDEVGLFRNLRILLWASFGALEVSITFAVPLIMISLYRELKKKMNDDVSRLRYYVWAVIVVISLLIVPICACNGLAIKTSNGFYLKDVEVEINFVYGFLGLFILDCGWAFLAMFIFVRIENKQEGNKAFCLDCYYINCLCKYKDYYYLKNKNEDETRDHYNTKLKEGRFNSIIAKCVLKNGCHALSIVVITFFAQLALFNSVFISFAVIAAPVESGSLLLLYLSSLFALISVLATGLKMVHKVESLVGFSLALVTLIFLLIGVAGGVGVFVSFVYKYTLLIQEYRNSRGVIAFLGPIVPSVLATTVGGIFTTIISCIKVKTADSLGGQPTTPQEIVSQGSENTPQEIVSQGSENTPQEDMVQRSGHTPQEDVIQRSGHTPNSSSANSLAVQAEMHV